MQELAEETQEESPTFDGGFDAVVEMYRNHSK